jgi:hypothetical protein
VEVTWPLGEVHVGGQGSVCRAAAGGNNGFCVKTLPEANSPGSIQKELKAIHLLRKHVDNQLTALKAPAIRASLTTLKSYLPSHSACATPPGETLPCLLLLRRFCEGQSLQELTAPGEPMPDLGTRVEIAKRLVRHLVSLEKIGFVHLDPYPDNVFLSNSRTLEVALIDLEGVGSIARNSEGRFGPSLDLFEKVPSAYGKEGFWILPPWYPCPSVNIPAPYGNQFVSAARWQTLSLAFFAITWGCKPFFWLSRSSQRTLSRVAKGNKPSYPVNLDEALRDRIPEAYKIALDRFGGNTERAEEFATIFEHGLNDPKSIPRGEDIQSLFFKRNWEA